MVTLIGRGGSCYECPRRSLPQGRTGPRYLASSETLCHSATIILLLPMIYFLLAAAPIPTLQLTILHDAAKVNGGVTPLHRPRRPRFTRATSSRTDQSDGCSTGIYRQTQYLCK